MKKILGLGIILMLHGMGSAVPGAQGKHKKNQQALCLTKQEVQEVIVLLWHGPETPPNSRAEGRYVRFETEKEFRRNLYIKLMVLWLEKRGREEL